MVRIFSAGFASSARFGFASQARATASSPPTMASRERKRRTNRTPSSNAFVGCRDVVALSHPRDLGLAHAEDRGERGLIDGELVGGAEDGLGQDGFLRGTGSGPFS